MRHAAGLSAGSPAVVALVDDDRRASRRIELAGQPGSGAATSHRMRGSWQARVDAGIGVW